MGKHPLVRMSVPENQVITDFIQHLKDFSIEDDSRFDFQLEQDNGGFSLKVRIKTNPPMKVGH